MSRKSHKEELRPSHQEELRPMEDALWESEARFRAFMDNSPATAWMKDARGRYVYLSKAFERQYKLRIDDCRNKTDAEIFSPEQAKQFRDHDLQTLAANCPLQVVEDAPDGRKALVTKFPFPTASGERFIAGVAIDITEREKAKEALRESEERLRLLGDNLPNSVVYQYTYPTWKRPPRILYISAGIQRLNGVTAKEVLNDYSVLERQILPDQFPAFEAAAEKSAHELSDFEYEVQTRLPDGEIRWMHFISHPRRQSDGRVVWDGIQTDITERKKAEEVSRQLSAIVQSSHDAIIGTTIDGTITSWNPGAKDLFGYWASEVIGRSIKILLPPEYPDETSDILKRVANREYTYDYETVRRRKDGILVEVSLRISPILDASGEVVGAAGVAHDVTRRKQAEEALLECEKRAATGRLAASVAHEVNNPLAGALNAICLARTRPDKAEEMLEVAERELRLVAHITHSINERLATSH